MSILRIILVIILWYVLTIQLPSEIVNEEGYKFVFFIASLVITSIMICIFFKEPMQAFVFKHIKIIIISMIVLMLMFFSLSLQDDYEDKN
ncbi:hypothetical protein CF088_19215 [Clostridium botulinum]|uniref:hypothetical protein n=1 Tax=Clostridium botulinum TaxID=1491 RepID=UPI000773E8A8|nr:hypothetical protein [Clostridium botulinum]APH21092.1 putative membrane protein [Clostridium botulinum]APQ69149.1 putative membrane protein [Clostridium botulinum]MBN3380753.1 hypothetical protein [Clostridium botulinum]MBN3407354.1 hypothetical protein [Clostridium botulinum]QDY17207.1 hypothetical protein CGQ27_08910 [Clostridium botulinum]